ncbi:hypothetical protein [Thermoactinomyces sp. CICC 10522]|uniref:hypothetical protein n=1 Tax=Thermoactinomyces sp. CICC 10522 TaxID=2767427 RepID=UPI0018DEC483|nr:hypothetical protein [Thermoactinomyces sp. CICC 10522]MBH8605602.1 hypothetical protein [Thermoactinomyces sp. CICC 10522]
MKDEFRQINILIEDLDQQIDRLLKHQASYPTVKGDKAIARLLDQMVLLENKIKGPSKTPASTL